MLGSARIKLSPLASLRLIELEPRAVTPSCETIPVCANASTKIWALPSPRSAAPRRRAPRAGCRPRSRTPPTAGARPSGSCPDRSNRSARRDQCPYLVEGGRDGLGAREIDSREHDAGSRRRAQPYADVFPGVQAAAKGRSSTRSFSARRGGSWLGPHVNRTGYKSGDRHRD